MKKKPTKPIEPVAEEAECSQSKDNYIEHNDKLTRSLRLLRWVLEQWKAAPPSRYDYLLTEEVHHLIRRIGLNAENHAALMNAVPLVALCPDGPIGEVSFDGPPKRTDQATLTVKAADDSSTLKCGVLAANCMVLPDRPEVKPKRTKKAKRAR